MAGTMRQLEERQLPAEVTTMLWSPKMDLLAVSNVKGEVVLHRLTWQRVWLLSPPDESDTTAHLAWRPDGKLLAVCYGISKLSCLVDVETKNIIHKTKLPTNEMTVCVKWLSLSNTEHESLLTSDKTNKPTGEYLPPLPSLIRSYSTEPERKEFLSHTLDMLFIGQKDGTALMYIFGMFYCGTITVGHGPILQITGGYNNPIWITWKDNNSIKTTRVSCPLFERSTAFLKVAQTQANIECLKDYLSRTLMATCEAWETILLEMDEKLTRYSETNQSGIMSADFLELLMIGIPTKNLETFLLRDLTEKGLKKFGHSIEMCYSNIQKLVSKNLTSVGMALVYQLSELRGMVRVGGTYEALGLRDETLVTNAINESEAFLAKSYEIEQVIDQSMRNYKAFFRWLYVAILQLTDERAPSEVSRVSQQELTFIAEFLSDFDKPRANGKVNLEKLGQYLRRENLQTPLTSEGSEWAAMLDTTDCLRNYAHIVKQDFNLSLLQSHVKLVAAVENVFAEAYQSLVDHFVMNSVSLPLFTSLMSSQIVTNDGNLLLAMHDSDSKFLKMFNIKYLPMEPISLGSKMITIDVSHKQGEYPKESIDTVIVDLQFYSQDYLSLLVLNKQTHASSLIQMPLHSISVLDYQDNDAVISITDFIGMTWPKPFQGISARRLAVSGPRKVAAILSENNRKIRLLETEAEPEDEEDEEEEEGRFVENMMDTTPAAHFSAETIKTDVQEFYKEES
ncbi:anaphase-promoting complex subunit 4 [Solenopsis invicta]|uniref:anaphase-promoting complex subunit 4 n=1 Tax=Solenopsis invicta TaxID=13686 RepID=UPI0005959BFB|nr:anaphase-promoting complex subunit 4 [Solenopsis invicta]XP_011166858.1 anaphase-promoting complex subunit 4 [Solenopsis invicta]XP_011166859.1 anaphase-promoting complex subunit 4 [Solenopsis invicta]